MDGDRGFGPDDPSVSVIREFGAASAHASPFPFLLAEPCLESEHYRTLVATFPSSRLFRSDTCAAENDDLRIPSTRVLDFGAFSSEWRRFVGYHTSQPFWHQISREFSKDIRLLYPELERTLDRPLEEWRAVRRGDGPGSEITLECEIVVSTSGATPRSSETESRTVSGNRLWTGLLQMPPPHEDAAAPFATSEPSLCDGVVEIPLRYTANSFIAFVNEPHSTRIVRETMPVPSVRRYVEFSAQVNHPVVGLLQRGAAQYEWFRFFQRQRYR